MLGQVSFDPFPASGALLPAALLVWVIVAITLTITWWGFRAIIYIYIHYVLPRKIPINAVIFLFVWLVAAWVIPNAVISLGSFCWRIRANIGSGGDVR